MAVGQGSKNERGFVRLRIDRWFEKKELDHVSRTPRSNKHYVVSRKTLVRSQAEHVEIDNLPTIDARVDF